MHSNDAQAFHIFYVIRFIFLLKIAIYKSITSISSQISFHLADSSDYARIFPNNDLKWSFDFVFDHTSYLSWVINFR